MYAIIIHSSFNKPSQICLQFNINSLSSNRRIKLRYQRSLHLDHSNPRYSDSSFNVRRTQRRPSDVHFIDRNSHKTGQSVLYKLFELIVAIAEVPQIQSIHIILMRYPNVVYSALSVFVREISAESDVINLRNIDKLSMAPNRAVLRSQRYFDT